MDARRARCRRIRQRKPVIYGLDTGPKEVNQLPSYQTGYLQPTDSDAESARSKPTSA